MSPRSCPQNGPASRVPNSTTRRSASAPLENSVAADTSISSIHRQYAKIIAVENTMRAGAARTFSERPRQAQHVLGEVGENQIGRNRRNLIQPGFAEFTLDIVFAGKAIAAVKLQADIGRFPGGIGGQYFAMLASAPQGSLRVEAARKP